MPTQNKKCGGIRRVTQLLTNVTGPHRHLPERARMQEKLAERADEAHRRPCRCQRDQPYRPTTTGQQMAKLGREEKRRRGEGERDK